jgi:hypothetical protein
LVEHFHGKEGVVGSSPIPGSRVGPERGTSGGKVIATIGVYGFDRDSFLATLRGAAVSLPESADQRAVLSEFSEAFERGDIDALVELMTEDAWLRMPPEPLEYQGRAAIAGFLRTRAIWRSERPVRLVPTRANGQPAFGYYVSDPHADVARVSGIFVLTMEGDAIRDRRSASAPLGRARCVRMLRFRAR